jgi:Holliday junction resolvase
MYNRFFNNGEIIETEPINIDELLEKEKINNKNDNWNKLDKTMKIQKLHAFAEKYGKDNSLAIKNIKMLKTFFNQCLEKNKLNKIKDVVYNKEKHEVESIPSLLFNSTTRNFTLKQTDKRVSTIKSLAPKKTVKKIPENIVFNLKEDISSNVV